MADIFCLVYATDILGINPAVAGTIILITLIWDAVSDPIVGSVVDRSAFLGARYGAAIRLTAPLGAIFLILTFSAHLLGDALETIAFICGLLLFRTAFTLVDIPDNALFARISRAKGQRISGASLRKLMATAASVAISLSSGWVFADHGQLPEAGRILAVASIAGGVGALAFILGSSAVKQWDHEQRPAPDPSSWFAIVKLLRNANVASLVLHIALSTLGMALFMSSLVFYARFILGHDAWFATAMTVFLIAQACGVVFWGWVASKTSSVRAIIQAAVTCVCAVIFFVSTDDSLLLILSCGVFGFCAGGLNALRWAIAPAVIDLAEKSLRRRNEAASMALFSLSVKTAIGVASMGLGAWLSVLAYEPGQLADPNQSFAFRAFIAIMVSAAILLSILPILRKELKIA